ncbi:MAG: type II secretion system protein, partial [Candidatus Aminicenantales bacterium]
MKKHIIADFWHNLPLYDIYFRKKNELMIIIYSFSVSYRLAWGLHMEGCPAGAGTISSHQEASMLKKEKGFTLIELLIVVAIIGIL